MYVCVCVCVCMWVKIDEKFEAQLYSEPTLFFYIDFL